MNSDHLHEVYLSLGTNLGNRRRNLHNAIRLIGKLVGSVVRSSSFIETEPWGFESAHKFLNAAVCVQTALTPRQLLSVTQDIERMMGRTRKSTPGNYHDRIIDIDILYYDDITVSDPDLVIPHPLIGERDFVKIPLSEIRDSQTHR